MHGATTEKYQRQQQKIGDDSGKVLETTAKDWGQQWKSIGDNGKGLGTTAKRQWQRIGDDSKETMAKNWRQWPSIGIHAENGSGVQQRIQPRQTDDESSLLELAVVQDKGSDDDKT